MLLQFKFKNHKCFYDETVLDLMATQEKRHMGSTFEVNGNNILPVIAIHGANASGKSSALEALKYMFEFIKFSNRMDVTRDLPTTPFALSDTADKENSEYEVSICLNDNEYRYGFSLNRDKITEEWLYEKKFALNTRASSKIIFERLDKDVTFGNKYSKYEKIWSLFGTDSNLNVDKLMVLSSLAIKEEDGILRDLYNYICKFNCKIEKQFQTASIDILNQNNTIYEKFQTIIHEFDPCLLGIC